MLALRTEGQCSLWTMDVIVSGLMALFYKRLRLWNSFLPKSMSSKNNEKMTLRVCQYKHMMMCKKGGEAEFDERGAVLLQRQASYRLLSK